MAGFLVTALNMLWLRGFGVRLRELVAGKCLNVGTFVTGWTVVTGLPGLRESLNSGSCLGVLTSWEEVWESGTAGTAENFGSCVCVRVRCKLVLCGFLRGEGVDVGTAWRIGKAVVGFCF